ncbi:hypothetical protein V5O48_000177 [Marasmius crinis-equi]|uniref:Uncharacterized protein n=1 Tax=Marasmius crinis-equi TaxID=585013 RepID=A0ABR3G2B4_9AGAR
MQRASTLGNRLSYAQGLTQQANPAATAAKLREKKKEYDGVAALDKASSLLLERINGMMEDCDVMANAGEGIRVTSIRLFKVILFPLLIVHGEVLEQWPKMFHILNLFLASHSQNSEGEDNSSDRDGQMLVRLPIDELQSTPQTDKS